MAISKIGTYMLARQHLRNEVRIILIKYLKIWGKYNTLLTKLWELQHTIMERGAPKPEHIILNT